MSSHRKKLLVATARRLAKSLSFWISSTADHSTVNVIRPTSSEFGMGYHASLVQLSLDVANFTHQGLLFEEIPTPLERGQSVGSRSIYAVSPGHIFFAEIEYARLLRRSEFAAALVSWDVDVIPRHFHLGFRQLNEIWVPSQMGADFLRKSTKRPIEVFPTPIAQFSGGASGVVRNRYKLNDSYVFGYQFDMGSSAERKNPWAAVQMYTSAFSTESKDHHLLLKCARADEASDGWRRLRELCGDRRDITLINEHWSQDLIASFYLDIDVYVSPHRSEGYGLTVAHALAHDRYVITTAYGGPVDFTSAAYSGQVPYKMVRVGQNAVYPENAQWAEPDISIGAELMRQAARDETRTREFGRMGGDYARTTFSFDRAAKWILERIGPVDL